MFRVFYQAVFIGVRTAGISLKYAAPLVAFFYGYGAGRALTAGCCAWIVLHANLAFASSAYLEYTAGYSMRRARYF